MERSLDGATLADLKEMYATNAAHVERSWAEWCRAKRAQGNVKQAGQRFLKGEAKGKISSLCRAELYDFCRSSLGLSLTDGALDPVAPRLPDKVDHIALFHKANANCPFLERVCGEYALFRQGFLKDSFVQLHSKDLEEMKPSKLEIFKTKGGRFEFRLEAKDSADEGWVGHVVGRDEVIYLVGFSKSYDQLATIVLTQHAYPDVLVGTQLLQYQAPSTNDFTELCISRLVACARKGKSEVAPANKQIARSWLYNMPKDQPNRLRTPAGWALRLSQHAFAATKEV